MIVWKYVVGFIVGLVVASALPVFGADISFVGKKVQTEYRVVVDGKELATKAVAIDGVSYSPNRAVADSLGLKVAFENKTVVINSGGDPNVELKQISARTAEIIKIQGLYSDKYGQLQYKWNDATPEQRPAIQEEIDALSAEVTPYTEERERLIKRRYELEAQATPTP